MFQGLNPLHEAVPLLVCGNVMLDGRFHEAAYEFLVALRRPEQWPPDLLPHARSIEQRLIAEGTLEATLEGIDTVTAESIAEQILDLVEAIDESLTRHRIEGPPEEDQFGLGDVHWRNLRPRSRKGERHRRDRRSYHESLGS
ncbi:MAG: hypothetical protein V3R99_11675 [Thermoguttaceae bacterium]